MMNPFGSTGCRALPVALLSLSTVCFSYTSTGRFHSRYRSRETPQALFDIIPKFHDLVAKPHAFRTWLKHVDLVSYHENRSSLNLAQPATSFSAWFSTCPAPTSVSTPLADLLVIGPSSVFQSTARSSAAVCRCNSKGNTLSDVRAEGEGRENQDGESG